MSESTKLQEERPSAWRGHLLPWTLGGLPLLVALLRVLMLTRMDPVSAAAVVAHADPLEMLLQATLLMLAATLTIGLPLLWIWWHQLTDDGTKHTARAAATILTITMLFVAPWPYIATMAAFALVFGIVYLRRRGAPAWSPQRWLQILVGFGVPLLLIAVLIDVGLAPEVVEHGRQTTGYVIDDDSRWLIVLRESDRLVQLIDTETVDGRYVCSMPGQGRYPSVIDLISRDHPAAYPRCPR